MAHYAVKIVKHRICVQITRWVSDDNPGIVECSFTDTVGRDWSFIEKMPVVTAEDIWSDRKFPRPGYIACQIVSKNQDGAGREIAGSVLRSPGVLRLWTARQHFKSLPTN